ncbi:cupin domain-containing protein [Myxosarcina sp. GI1]|uniref:cupin domain-containing protein n=1 Tax=Myxosarcina sp. GI1 TaxID=1541065 RepID=UPI000907C72C|nr:cupin domain-containing protein [Myxosarcina sp. GI1]
MNQRCMIPVIKTARDYQAYRIKPEDTNRVAIVFDPDSADDSLTVCVEIFDPGGATPPHRHNFAVEIFFILKGEGMAICDGKEVPLNTGDSVLMPKTGIHYLKNTGTQRLYVLSIMVPNEDFSELVRSGTPTELDSEDLQVLSRMDSLISC